MNLKVFVTPALLKTFRSLAGTDDALRGLLRASIPEFQNEWFDSNQKLLLEGQKQGVWPPGLDCVDWPEMRFVAADGDTVKYPVWVIPSSPDYCFIVSPIDRCTIPGGEGSAGVLYYADYPAMMDGKHIDWKHWQMHKLAYVRDGLHKTHSVQ